MDPDAVLSAEGGNVIAVKNAGNGALTVEMSVNGDSEDASGSEITTPALKVLLRTPEGMQTYRHREWAARSRMDGDRRHSFVGIEARETELLADQSAGQVIPLEDLHLRAAEFRVVVCRVLAEESSIR
jgi:hypothetical protein